jgi:hypothetical protein
MKNDRISPLFKKVILPSLIILTSLTIFFLYHYNLKSDYFLPVIKALPEKSYAETYETPGLSAVERARKSIALVLTY